VKRELMDILACPVCKGDLVLNVMEEDDTEVVKGIISCNACNIDYPIDDGIPNMLPPENR